MEIQTLLAGEPNSPTGQKPKPPSGEAQDNPSNLVGPISHTVSSHACVITPDDVEKKLEIERKALFENTVNEKLKIPTAYFKVAVLIVRWNETVDGFREGHSEEVFVYQLFPKVLELTGLDREAEPLAAGSIQLRM